MADESDPPRKFYGLKPKEFERVNDVPPPAPPDSTDAAAAGAPTPAYDPNQRIDVRDLTRAASGAGPALGHNAVVNRANEVHAVLRDQYQHDKAAGLFRVNPADDKQRRRRIRNYWIFVFLWNTPFGAIAWFVNPTREMGPASAIVFVCAIAAMALMTSYVTWQTFFLRTER
jgi:hypothetical protein